MPFQGHGRTRKSQGSGYGHETNNYPHRPDSPNLLHPRTLHIYDQDNHIGHCLRKVTSIWRIRLSSTDARGADSLLAASGTPEPLLPTRLLVHCRYSNVYHWYRLYDIGLSSSPHKSVLGITYVGRTRTPSRMGPLYYVYPGHVLQRWELPQKEHQGNSKSVEEGEQDAHLDTLRPLWQHEPLGWYSTWCGLPWVLADFLRTP